MKRGRVEAGELIHMRLEGTVLAYRAGTANEHTASLTIAAAHTDSPGLHLKDRSAAIVDGLLQVPVEVYGGPILATWLDREFLIVGKIAIRNSAIAREGAGTGSSVVFQSSAGRDHSEPRNPSEPRGE